MGVVRIDNALEKEIAAFIKKQENKYRYPSKSAFLNILINDYFENQRSDQGSKAKKR